MIHSETVALVEAILNRNEGFQGTSIDEEKLQLFTEIRRQAGELSHLLRGTLTVRPPESTKRNAIVMLDITLPVGIFNESVRRRLAALIERADDVSFAAPGGKSLRISFSVHGVWKQ